MRNYASGPRWGSVTPAKELSRKERKEMEGGNGMSEANEVTLSLLPPWVKTHGY